MHLEINRATKRYSSHYALEDFSAEFHPGELVAITGVRGAGKSTLLRALSGGIGLNNGEVSFDGQLFDDSEPEIRRSFVYIPDVPPLLADDTVFRNISLFLTQYKKTEEVGIGDKVIELLEKFELLAEANTKVLDLDSSQAYKVALVIVATIDPAIWILDEPFSAGIDPKGCRLFKKLARQTVDRGGTVIYTTKQIHPDDEFADRICVINSGRNYLDIPYSELSGRVESDLLLSKLVGSV